MEYNGFNFLSKDNSSIIKHLGNGFYAFLTSLMVLSGASFGNEIHAQCTGSTQFSTTKIPCSGLINTVISVPKLRYIKVNVVNGVNYTFSSTRSGITLRNDSNNNLVGNTTGSSISYTSTFSGLIRVYNCTAPDLTATVSYIANNTGSNIQDSQLACGTNNWIGHVYKRLDNSLVTSPSNANAFTSYIGYINEPEIFSEGFGGNTNCFPTISNNVNVINTYSEFFAIKFCNQSVKPKGAYVLSSLTTDDGLRIYAAGTLVFDRWIHQTPTTYNNILFQHSGNSKLEMHYFESDGDNILNVGTMTRVNNILTSNLNQSICVGISPAQITGTNVLTTAPISAASGYAVTYQWQVSTDNVNFSNISGATTQNYTQAQTAPGTYYFRRLATITNTNPGSIPIAAVDESNIAQLVIKPTPNGTISGEVICAGTSPAHITFTASINSGPYSLIINGVTYNNVITGVAFNVIAPLVTTVYNLTKITDINGCINP